MAVTIIELTYYMNVNYGGFTLSSHRFKVLKEVLALTLHIEYIQRYAYL